jgi:c-di-GMP-binding flagellar brake protein YcgR
MSANAPTERRKHPRYPLAAGVDFYHGPTRRSFPARCVDISQGGLLMLVPAGTPVQPGQSVRLGLGSARRPELAPLSRQSVDATVVRVDRQALLSAGHLAVGVRFAET